MKWLVDPQRATTSPQNAVRICNACDDIGVVELLPKVQVRTLVLRCRRDNVAPCEQGCLIARSVPRAKFVALENDNRMMLAGEPAWLRLIGEIATLPRGVRLSRKHAPAQPEARARRSTRQAHEPARATENRYAAATRSASFLRA